VEYKPFLRELGDTKNTVDLSLDAYTRTNVLIPSLASANTTTNLAAWFYEPIATSPDASTKPPIVVMAHGLVSTGSGLE